MQTFQDRTEIPEQYIWDLSSIFSTKDAWEASFKSLQARVPELEALKGTLSRSGDALLTVLQKRDALFEELWRLYVYTSMHLDENTTNGLYQGMADRATQLRVRVATASSYIDPEILALPETTLEQFMKDTAGLALYQHELEDLGRRRAHIRSAEVEGVLAAVGEITGTPDDIFSMIDNADLHLPQIKDESGKEVQLTQGNYLLFIRSTDRDVRKDAFEALHGTFLKQRNTIAATLSGQMKGDLFYTRQRNFATCRERALSRNNIPLSVYDNLVATIGEHLSVLSRYLRLRKRMLDLHEMHMYDLYVPIVEEVGDQISYEEARETVVRGLAPLGEAYIATLKQAFSQRWIDVYETPGKRSGAYSGGAYGTYPFILLNFQDKRESLYTLAHELGHSMHSYYTRTNQPFLYGDYTIFVAEVASTLNEELLTEYLLQHTTDKAARLAILNHSLEDFRGTLFRQTMFAEYEQQIHEYAEQGEPLTADTLTALYMKLNEKYYGSETVIDDLIGIEWARIPHFYYNFYVYQYATGISAASTLARQILSEGEAAVKRYLNFLKSGSSDYSIELLKRAGVDMTTPEPVRQACQVFESRLAQMEELLG